MRHPSPPRPADLPSVPRASPVRPDRAAPPEPIRPIRPIRPARHPSALPAIARGAAQSLGLVLGLVALGAAAHLAAAPRPEAPAAVPAGVEEATPRARPEPRPAERASPYLVAVSDPVPELWLVDGFNVLNAAVLRGAERRGFWRSEARGRLVERVAPLAARFPVCVVFDGDQPPDPGTPSGPVEVVFAPSADEWLLRRVRGAPEPGRLVLVTADRSLADRARHAGARVVAPREFLARCDAGDADAEPAPA